MRPARRRRCIRRRRQHGGQAFGIQRRACLGLGRPVPADHLAQKACVGAAQQPAQLGRARAGDLPLVRVERRGEGAQQGAAIACGLGRALPVAPNHRARRGHGRGVRHRAERLLVERLPQRLERAAVGRAREGPRAKHDDRRGSRRRRNPQVRARLQRHDARRVVQAFGRALRQPVARDHRKPAVVIGAGHRGVLQVHLAHVAQQIGLVQRGQQRPLQLDGVEGQHCDARVAVDGLGCFERRDQRGAQQDTQPVFAELGLAIGNDQQGEPRATQRARAFPWQRAAAEHRMRQPVAERATCFRRRMAVGDLVGRQRPSRRVDGHMQDVLGRCVERLRRIVRRDAHALDDELALHAVSPRAQIGAGTVVQPNAADDGRVIAHRLLRGRGRSA